MTTERDRLAALLHEKGLGCLRTSRFVAYCTPETEDHLIAADRLLTAGVRVAPTAHTPNCRNTCTTCPRNCCGHHNEYWP